MTHATAEGLYALLPALYRERDAALGHPLRDLVGLLAREAAVVEDDVAALYESWFVETAPEWVLPYIGDLVGVTALADTGLSRRAEIAHTIGYRRRKGTPAVLELLARDVTGWPARVVESFDLLGWTQYLAHLRRHAVRTPDLRDAGALELLGGPFEAATRTVEVRRIAPRRGRHNIPHVALWLFRLEAFPLERATARRLPDGTDRHFRVSPLGHDAPLFHLPVTESAGDRLAGEEHVPSPIRRRAFHAAPAGEYGAGASVRVFRDGVPLALAEVEVCDLAGWARPLPPGKLVGIDPALGRLAFAAGEEPAAGVEVDFAYGFAGRLGGGPYPRQEGSAPLDSALELVVGPGEHATVAAAIDAWDAAGRPRAVVTIADSRTYEETPAVPPIPAGGRLELRAADGQRPVLLLAGDLAVSGAGEESAFAVDGLAIAGGALAAGGELDRLDLRHATLVPGRSFDADGEPTAPGAVSLAVSAAAARVTIERSIVGAVESAPDCLLAVRDSIVDAGSATAAALAGPGGAGSGGALTVSASTVVGTVATVELTLGENSLFLGRVVAARRQQGCVRFSFLPPESRAPRRFRCQPVVPEGATPSEAAARTARVRPRFVSLAYGQPGYGQLRRRGPEAIFRGADDGTEMGAFSHLHAPQREENLRRRLDEYLPVGLEAGIFYST